MYWAHSLDLDLWAGTWTGLYSSGPIRRVEHVHARLCDVWRNVTRRLRKWDDKLNVSHTIPSEQVRGRRSWCTGTICFWSSNRPPQTENGTVLSNVLYLTRAAVSVVSVSTGANSPSYDNNKAPTETRAPLLLVFSCLHLYGLVCSTWATDQTRNSSFAD